MSTDRIAWIDVETTGLDPHTDHLLEVACQITDTDLNPLGDTYHAIIWHTDIHAKTLRFNCAPVVREMHDASGLWDQLPGGQYIPRVERELLDHIRRHAPEPRQARLGGNSASLDAGFIREHLPAVSKHLHYRIVDVSSLAAVADWWTGCGFYPKETRHEAVADIHETIAEARWLREQLAKVER